MIKTTVTVPEVLTRIAALSERDLHRFYGWFVSVDPEAASDALDDFLAYDEARGS